MSKTKRKLKTEVIKLGVVGVDSGQLIICDPCYLESEYKPKLEGGCDHEIYKHEKTGKLWQFTYGQEPQMVIVNKFPGTYATVIPEYGKNPNQLIQEGEFVKTDIDPSAHVPNGEFSYRGICKATLRSENQSGQINFSLGHEGAAVAFRSGMGDGVYEVYGEFITHELWGRRLKKVWVELMTDEDLED